MYILEMYVHRLFALIPTPVVDIMCKFQKYKKIKVSKAGEWGKEREGAFLAPHPFLRYN